jgi:hypothetical protein
MLHETARGIGQGKGDGIWNFQRIKEKVVRKEE